MPHLILECSEKIAAEINFNALFSDFHGYLADSLPTQASSCKSRISVYDNYFIGEDFEKKTFIHLSLKILAGRSDEKKNAVCQYLLSHLQALVKNLSIEKPAVSVELTELSPFYFK